MTTETKFRGGLALTLICIIIMQFFYFENIRKFDEYKVSTTKQIDSLQTLSDSLQTENFELNHWNGIEELVIDELSHKYPNYRNLSNDIEKEKNSNKYE